MQSKQANVILPVLLFVLVIGTSIHFIHNNDIWMHIEIGEYIWQNKHLPENDQWSFTAQDNNLVLHEWLSQLTFYIVYSLAGTNGIIIFKALIVFLAFFFLYKAINKNNYITIIILLFVNFISEFHSLVRPHVFSWLFFAILIWGLEKRKHFVIPIILVIWANMHSSVIMGFFVLLVYIGESMIINYLKHGVNARVKKDIKFLVISFIALLVNPYTYEILLYPFRTIGFSQYIWEWKPFLITDIHLWIFIVFLGLTLVPLLVSVLSKKSSIRIKEIIIILVFSYFAFTSRRNTIIAAILLAPIASKYLYKVLHNKIPEKTNTNIIFVILLVLCGWFIITKIGGFTFGIEEGRLPVNAVDFMGKNNINGNVFNEFEFGGYIILKLYPNNKVFIDGRIPLFGKKILEDYRKIVFAEEDAVIKIAEYKPDIFLVKHSSKVEDLLQNLNATKLVYFDDYVSLYVINTKKYGNISGFKIIYPKISAIPDDVDGAIDEYMYLLEISPSFVGVNKNLGLLYLKNNETESARLYLDKYLAKYSDDVAVIRIRRQIG